jgi:hypothetical protein
MEFHKLRTNLKESQNNKFIPQGAKKIFQVLEENGDLNADILHIQNSQWYLA